MRALAGLFVEVAAGDHVVDRQADAGVEIAAKLEDVGLGVNRVEVGREDRRRLLEERVVIVPGTQLRDRDAALLGKLGVDLALELLERLARQPVELVEKLEHLLLRLFGEIKLKRVVIGKAELPGRLVSEFDERLQLGLDERADAFAAFPDGLAFLRSRAIP